MTDIAPTIKKSRRFRPESAPVQQPVDVENKRLPVTRHTVPDSKRLSVVPKWKKDNPKSPMSPAAKRFELYRQVKTVGEYRTLMREAGTPHYANLDLARDKARGYINFDYSK